MSKYRKHIWANETMPYYKQYLNEMEAQIDKLTKEGGGGGSGMQKYEINPDFDDETEEIIFMHDGEKLTFEDVYDAVNDPNKYVFLNNGGDVYNLYYFDDETISFIMVCQWSEYDLGESSISRHGIYEYDMHNDGKIVRLNDDYIPVRIDLFAQLYNGEHIIVCNDVTVDFEWLHNTLLDYGQTIRLYDGNRYYILSHNTSNEISFTHVQNTENVLEVEFIKMYPDNSVASYSIKINGELHYN